VHAQETKLFEVSSHLESELISLSREKQRPWGSTTIQTVKQQSTSTDNSLAVLMHCNGGERIAIQMTRDDRNESELSFSDTSVQIGPTYK
jgi:hypothetical protein